MKILLVCLAGEALLQYRVLRCAAEFANAVYVLGPPGARRLASSLFCTRFISASLASELPDLDRPRRVIDAVISAHGIDMVVPGDGPAVRLLALLRPLRARTYPVPDHRTFDLLDDKWRFGELCRSITIRHPTPRLYHDRDILHADLTSGAVRLPVVVKPTNMSGGRGVHIIRSTTEVALTRRLAYSPVLVQPYIDGTDMGLSAFCRDGQVEAKVIYRRQRGNCIFTSSPELAELAGRIVEHVAYDGVVNFDARLDRSGRIHVLECNPRFWFSMDMTLLAGLNFVALAVEGYLPRALSPESMGAVLKSNQSLLRTLTAPLTLTAHDMAVLWYRLRDPVPPLCALLDRVSGRLRKGSRTYESGLVATSDSATTRR